MYEWRKEVDNWIWFSAAIVTALIACGIGKLGWPGSEFLFSAAGAALMKARRNGHEKSDSGHGNRPAA